MALFRVAILALAIFGANGASCPSSFNSAEGQALALKLNPMIQDCEKDCTHDSDDSDKSLPVCDGQNKEWGVKCKAAKCGDAMKDITADDIECLIILSGDSAYKEQVLASQRDMALKCGHTDAGFLPYLPPKDKTCGSAEELQQSLESKCPEDCDGEKDSKDSNACDPGQPPRGEACDNKYCHKEINDMTGGQLRCLSDKMGTGYFQIVEYIGQNYAEPCGAGDAEFLKHEAPPAEDSDHDSDHDHDHSTADKVKDAVLGLAETIGISAGGAAFFIGALVVFVIWRRRKANKVQVVQQQPV